MMLRNVFILDCIYIQVRMVVADGLSYVWHHNICNTYDAVHSLVTQAKGIV